MNFYDAKYILSEYEKWGKGKKNTLLFTNGNNQRSSIIHRAQINEIGAELPVFFTFYTFNYTFNQC